MSTRELNREGGGNPPRPTPYLTAALLCERILVEKDNVKSIIRIVDKITHTVEGPDPPHVMEPFTHTLSMLVAFRRGETVESRQLGVVIVGPTGNRTDIVGSPVNFEGEPGSGIDVLGQFTMNIEQAGIYWFEISIDGQIITRIPLRVVYERIVKLPATP